jgi:hypothetical protein
MKQIHVNRKGWILADYGNEILERSVEDDSIFEERPELELTTPCRLWTGARSSGGYGRYSVLDKNLAHQVSHLVFNRNGDPIPKGLQVCHHCDVPGCVEPTHLFEGTAKDNRDDCVNKGRGHHDHRKESTSKISRSLTGRKLSPEHCANIALAMLDRSDELSASMSERMKGVPKTEDHRKKIGDAQRGKKRGPYKGK